MGARAEQSSSQARPDRRIELREAETSDGITMWRMARGRAAADGLSPFFYMVLVKHFGRSCMIVEKDGEPIGYIVAAAPRASGVVRILDMCLRAPHDTGETMFEMLAALCTRPAYRNAQYLEPAASCDPTLAKALRDLLGTELAKRSPPAGGQSAAAG